MLAQTREMAADADELVQATKGRLTDHLAARYGATVAEWDGEATDEFRNELRALREVCQDIVNLRRGDHSGTRLFMEQERLERERGKTDEELFEQFREWAKTPEVRDCLCANWISPEDRKQRIREIFGCKPEKSDATNGVSNSNPPRPKTNQAKSNYAQGNTKYVCHQSNGNIMEVARTGPNAFLTVRYTSRYQRRPK